MVESIANARARFAKLPSLRDFRARYPDAFKTPKMLPAVAFPIATRATPLSQSVLEAIDAASLRNTTKESGETSSAKAASAAFENQNELRKPFLRDGSEYKTVYSKDLPTPRKVEIETIGPLLSLLDNVKR